jgi:proteasome lid subunit RPN8/RPN11
VTHATLFLPERLSAQIRDAARRAHPSECCGLVEGVVTRAGWSAETVHEANNLADEPRRRFLVDPAVQFALLRRLRNSGRAIIGCFHSHPGGTPVPSDEDAREAAEDGFVWVIAAGSPEDGYVLGAHVFDASAQRFVALRLEG